MKYLVKFIFRYYHPDYFDLKKRTPKKDYEVYSELIIKYEPSQDRPFIDKLSLDMSKSEIDINVDKIYEVRWEDEKEYTKNYIGVETGEWADGDGGCWIEIKYYNKMFVYFNMGCPEPMDD